MPKWSLLRVNLIHEAKGFSPFEIACLILTKTFRKMVFSLFIPIQDYHVLWVINLTTVNLNIYTNTKEESSWRPDLHLNSLCLQNKPL